MNENIRLERIQVTRLFGRFSYDIDLNNGQPVSILIAPNGCGKTTIFNLLNYMFHPTLSGYNTIADVPFDSCICTLSNGRSVVLERRTRKIRQRLWDETNIEDEDISPEMLERLRSSRMERWTNVAELFLTIDSAEPINVSGAMTRARNYAVHTGRDLSDMTEEDLTLLEIDEAEMGGSPSRLRRAYMNQGETLHLIRTTLKDQQCDLAINFIRADRLYGRQDSDGSLDRLSAYYYRMNNRERERRRDRSPLEQIQRNTQRLYGKILDDYNDLQRDMKDQLPQMYLNHRYDRMEWEEFQRQWNEYQENIRKYSDIGLLASGQPILAPEELHKAYIEKGEFLTVYLNAFRQTLVPLEEHYSQLKLFVDILNHRNRVTHKVFSYSKEGIAITVDGRGLQLDRLSSGEKNDIVMFYNLIFGSEKNGLVLIDEPEISLHIEWQREYLDRLLEICNMNGLQAIVATHSPNIVNAHTDLYARKGLRNENEG